MERKIELSSGETVFFRAWKRKAEKAYKEALNVRYKRDVETGDMSLMEEVFESDLDRACEASLPIVIERIERAGAEIPFSPEWLDNLEVKDYGLLEAAALELRLEARKAGEKKAAATA